LFDKAKLPYGCHPELAALLVAEVRGLQEMVLICQRSGSPCPCDAKNSEKMIQYHFFRGKLSQK